MTTEKRQTAWHKVPPSADLIFVCDVLHHIPGRAAWLAKLTSEMKPGARLVLLEFMEGKLPAGTTFAFDQYRRLRRCNLRRNAQEAQHRLAPANDVAELVAPRELLTRRLDVTQVAKRFDPTNDSAVVIAKHGGRDTDGNAAAIVMLDAVLVCRPRPSASL